MGMLDALIYGIRHVVAGTVTFPDRDTIEFVGAAVTDDPTNKRTVVTLNASAAGQVNAVPNTIVQRDDTGGVVAAGVTATALEVDGPALVTGALAVSGPMDANLGLNVNVRPLAITTPIATPPTP